MSQVTIPADIDEFPVSYAFRKYAPEIGAAALEYSRAVYDNTLLTLREMEAARVRTAHINGCLICKNGQAARDFDEGVAVSDKKFVRPMSTRGDVPTDAFYDAIPNWRNSDLFSPRERLAIEYAEKMGEAPRSLPEDSEFWKRMHAHFSEKEIVDLTLSVASWMGLGRVMHVLSLDTACMVLPAA